MPDLYPEWRVGAISLTEAPYAVPFGGVDYGAPENVTQILQSLLQDGDIELSSRTGNRTLVLPVLIEDSDMAALAQAEAALVLECDKPRNEVYIDPGDGYGAPFIFDVFRGQIVFNRDDNYEIHGFRSYSLTFRALPFPRSVDEVVTEALPASGSTTTLVNDGSATTNWTGTINGVSTAPSVTSGAVGLTSASVLGPVTIALTYTAAITTSSTKYLVVDWKPASPGQSPTLRAYADGVELEQIARAASPTAGFTRSWFGPVAAASVAVLRLDGYSVPTIHGATSGAEARSLHIDNINRTDIPPTLGSARQLLRSIDVSGSARGPVALAIEHASSALGEVYAYVYPDVDESGRSTAGYVPVLRPYRVAGGATTTTDAAMVSGARDDLLTGTSTFDVPLSRLFRGGHLFAVKAGYVAAIGPQVVTFDWTMQVRVNGVGVGPIESGSTAVSLASAAGSLVTLGRRTAPPLDVDPASSAVLRVTITATAPGGATEVRLDDGYLFNTDLGRLLGPVPCGTATPSSGGSANRVFVEPASLAVPRQTVRIGYAADRSDSFHPTGLGGWQFFEIKPGRNTILTVTTNAENASVSARHFPYWHTHAAS